jgi:hypothetical protein
MCVFAVFAWTEKHSRLATTTVWYAQLRTATIANVKLVLPAININIDAASYANDGVDNFTAATVIITVNAHTARIVVTNVVLDINGCCVLSML